MGGFCAVAAVRATPRAQGACGCRELCGPARQSTDRLRGNEHSLDHASPISFTNRLTPAFILRLYLVTTKPEKKIRSSLRARVIET